MPESSNSLKRGSETTPKSSKKTKSTSAYDPCFQQLLKDGGISIVPQSRPSNFDELINVIGQERLSLSPSSCQSEFDAFVDANDKATTEDEVISNVVPFYLAEIIRKSE